MSKSALSIILLVILVTVVVLANWVIPVELFIQQFWKTAPGQIVECHETDNGDFGPSDATVSYSFSVNGKVFQNRGLRPQWHEYSSFGKGGYSSGLSYLELAMIQVQSAKGSMSCPTNRIDIMDTETPEYMKKNYPVGKKVTISYNPLNPRTSVLEVHDQSSFWDIYFPHGHFWYHSQQDENKNTQ